MFLDAVKVKNKPVKLVIVNDSTATLDLKSCTRSKTRVTPLGFKLVPISKRE